MQVFPMNLPAEIRRHAANDGEGAVVATGPLPIMAMGLLALDPKDRETCRIFSELGEMTCAEAQAALDRWAAQN